MTVAVAGAVAAVAVLSIFYVLIHVDIDSVPHSKLFFFNVYIYLVMTDMQWGKNIPEFLIFAGNTHDPLITIFSYKKIQKYI